MSTDNEQRIRELAHHIWESEGCPQGQALRHWHMAQRLIEAGRPRAIDMTEPSPSPAPAAIDVASDVAARPKPAAAKPAAGRGHQVAGTPPAKGRTR